MNKETEDMSPANLSLWREEDLHQIFDRLLATDLLHLFHVSSERELGLIGEKYREACSVQSKLPKKKKKL